MVINEPTINTNIAAAIWYITKSLSDAVGHNKGFKNGGDRNAGANSALVISADMRATRVGNKDFSSSSMLPLTIVNMDPYKREKLVLFPHNTQTEKTRPHPTN